MSDDLDAFLKGNDEPEPAPAIEPDAPKPDEAAPTPESEDDEPELAPGTMVPVAAIQGERAQKRDWKERAIRAEADRDAKAAAQATADAELARIRSELDALKKAPPAVAPPAAQAQPAAAMTLPNPIEDPEGHARALSIMRANDQLETRLNYSEEMLREKEGEEAVDAAVATFRQMVEENDAKFGKQANPLRIQLTNQRNPYRWMFNEVKKAAAAKEIGDDPAAYRAKIEAEIRAQLQATPAAEPAAPEAPRLPSSLANVRSAQARSEPAWTGPTSLESIFPT